MAYLKAEEEMNDIANQEQDINKINEEITNIQNVILKVMNKAVWAYKQLDKPCNLEYHALLCPNYCWSCKKQGEIRKVAYDLLTLKEALEIVKSDLEELRQMIEDEKIPFDEDDAGAEEGGVCLNFIKSIESLAGNIKLEVLSKSAQGDIQKIAKRVRDVLNKSKKYGIECLPSTKRALKRDARQKADKEINALGSCH